MKTKTITAVGIVVTVAIGIAAGVGMVADEEESVEPQTAEQCSDGEISVPLQMDGLFVYKRMCVPSESYDEVVENIVDYYDADHSDDTGSYDFDINDFGYVMPIISREINENIEQVLSDIVVFMQTHDQFLMEDLKNIYIDSMRPSGPVEEPIGFDVTF